MKRELLKSPCLLAAGGMLYICAEAMHYGSIRWTGFAVGGAAFILIGIVNLWLPWEMSIVQQALITALVVTGVELYAGLILNICAGFSLWDCHGMPFDILGQICLPRMLMWFALAFPAIVLDDWLRWRIGGAKKPVYYFFNKEENKYE